MSIPADGKTFSSYNLANLLKSSLPNTSGIDPVFPVKSSITEAAQSVLKQQLEAIFHFNQVMYDKYKTYIPNNIEAAYEDLWGDSAPVVKLSTENKKEIVKLFISGYKEDADYCKTQLDLLEKTADPQRLLDDIYEKMRYRLFLAREANELSVFDNTLFKKAIYDIDQELLQKIKPYISQFQIDFEKYDKYATRASETIHILDLDGYKTHARQELSKLIKLYEKSGNTAAINDIKSRLSVLDNPLLPGIKGINYSNLPENANANKIQLEHSRGIFYYISRLLSDAKASLQQSLKLNAQPKKAEGSSSENNKNHAEKTIQTHLEPPTQNNDISASAATAAAGTDIKPPTSTLSVKTEKDTVNNVSVPIASTEINYQEHKPTSVLFGSKFKYKKQPKEVAAIEPEEHPLASILAEKNHKNLLIDLLKGNLSKQKLKESEIKNLLTTIGCTWEVNGCRTKFTYKEKIGYSLQVKESGGYHKKSKDGNKHGGKNTYLHPVVLEHVKNFLERIKVTPEILWPKEFSASGATVSASTKSKSM